MKNLTKPLYESPKKESNNENFGEFGLECICCGRPMAAGACLMVHMNTRWHAVSPELKEEEVAEKTGYDSQGNFPIGSECAKKMIGFTSPGLLEKSHPKFKPKKTLKIIENI